MIYTIQEISTDKLSGSTYVLVHFWPDAQSRHRGDTPSLVNDFLMQLRPTGSRIVTDAEGRWKRIDGSYIDPLEAKPNDDFEREQIVFDPAAEIAANIAAYITRATQKNYSGDHTGDASKPFFVAGERIAQTHYVIERDDSDPHAVLAHPGVLAMQSEIESSAAAQEAGGV